MNSHSNVIAAALLLHFFIHIVNRGELPRYAGFFVG